MGFSWKRSKNSQNHLYGHPDVFSLLTSTKFPVPAVWWMNINRVTLQHDREFIMFRFYFSLFTFLLCVIFKSEWYLRASFWVLLHAMFTYDRKQAAQRLKLRESPLTINKRNIIRWNLYRDNNFYSRRQVYIEGKVCPKIMSQVSIIL